MRLCQKINLCWLLFELLLDLILIIVSIILLSEIADEFDDVLKHGGDIHVLDDHQFLGPVQIICLDNQMVYQHHNNCTKTLTNLSPITATQNYFSLKYLEIIRRESHTTMGDIFAARHDFYIILSIYIVVIYFLGCGYKLNQIQKGELFISYIFVISYYENHLSTFKMMLISLFTITEIYPGILLLEYIPGYSLAVAIVYGILVSCCLTVLPSTQCYKQYPNIKFITIIIIMLMLIGYIFLIIFPLFGLNIYALQFNLKFKSQTKGTLSNEFVYKVNVLRIFAIYMGLSGWIKTLKPILEICCGRDVKANTLLSGQRKTSYSGSSYSQDNDL